MPQSQSISSSDNVFPEWLSFEYLRKQGLLHIGQLSGKIWTDHNVHDPGITILEVLCYALIDLGYRNQFDTSSIFARDASQLGQQDDNFFSPAEILSSNPLSMADFKRLLLDMPGVRNAWLEKTTAPLEACLEKKTTAEQEACLNKALTQEVPIFIDKSDKKLTFNTNGNPPLHIKGLYDVYIDLEPFTPQFGNCDKLEKEEMVVAAIWKQLQAHRTLCEDFKRVHVLKPESVRFCMEIDLTPTAVPEDVFVEIFEAIQEFLTPTPRFYTLQEMLEKGRTIDQIFEGRPLLTNDQGLPLSHGFLDTADLNSLAPKSEIHISDIYNIILSKLPSGGVRAIRSLILFSETMPAGDPWILKLDPLKSPRLDLSTCEILYSKGQLPIQFETESARQKLNQRLANYNKIRRKPYELGFDIPQGKHYDFSDYTSIQREFPAVYGINEGQLPDTVGQMDEKERQSRELRLRQALQLKGYLAFFDQMLANYLAQLGNVRQLFALRPKTEPQSSYFNAVLTSMPDADKVLRGAESAPGTPPESYTLFRRRPLAFLRLRSKAEKAKKTAYSDYKGVFSSRALRDNATYFFQKAFEDGSVLLDIVDRWETEDPNISPCDRFYYVFSLSGEGAVLLSNTFYETRAAAQEGAELARYLGFLSRCYLNDESEMGFSGLLIYDPLGYADFLNQITESQDVFLKRRERFLDHLLARFAEQFTEYTLLAYAMDGKAKAQPEVVKDKARFLSHYPRISRNRGKGFDYTQAKVWDTDNVSGFEQRVAGFMGLDNWQRRTLNHLKLTTSLFAKFQTNWKANGNIVFQAERVLPEDYLQKIFKNENIVKTDCTDESVYGFKLKDPVDGCDILYLPCFYTVAARDEAIEFWENYFTGKKVASWERTDRFRFVLRNADDKIILKSKLFFSSKESAQTAFYHTVQLALEAKNYQNIDNGISQGATEDFSFVLNNAAGETMAIHPNFYTDALQRDAIKNAFIEFVKTCWLRFSVEKSDEFLDWQVTSAQGTVLFVGTQRRKIGDEAGAFETIWQALQWARQKNGWHLTMTPSGRYYWSLGKIDAKARLFLPSPNPQNWIEIGRSFDEYPTEIAAQEALAHIKAALSQSVYLENALPPEGNAGYRFQLIFPDDGIPLFQSDVFYNTLTEAAIAFEAFLGAAADPANYEPLGNGKLFIKFSYDKREDNVDRNAVDPVTVITIKGTATSFNPFPANADYKSIIAQKVKEKMPSLRTILPKPSEYFHRFLVPHKEGTAVYQLTGIKRYADEKTAYDALTTVLPLFETPGLTVEFSPFLDNYRLLLKVDGAVVATADEEFVKPPEWLLPTRLKSDVDVVSDAFGYKIGFLDCACELQYFKSADDFVFDTVEQAVEKGTEIWNAILKNCPGDATKDAYFLQNTNNNLEIVSNSNIVQAFVTFKTAKEAENSKSVACSLWGQGLKIGGIEVQKVFSADYQVSEYLSLLPSYWLKRGLQIPSAITEFNRFRLRNESYAIACYYKTFSNTTDRDNAAQEFFSYWKKADKQFPDISGVSMLRESAEKLVANPKKCPPQLKIKPYTFQFSFNCGPVCYLISSFSAFETEENVQTAIKDTSLIAWVNLLADSNAYTICDIHGNGSEYELQVFDYKNVALEAALRIVTNEPILTEQAALETVKKLVDCSARYPLYLDENGKIRFRLGRKKTKAAAPPVKEVDEFVYEWISIQFYETIHEGMSAFAEFLRLLQYQANIRSTEKPFSLDIGEIMLESKEYPIDEQAYKGQECDIKLKQEWTTWETGVEGQLLTRVFHPEGVVVVLDNASCGYTYQVVNDGYYLAEHPHKYRYAEDRTRQKKAVQRLYNCGKENNPISKFVIGEKNVRMAEIEKSGIKKGVADNVEIKGGICFQFNFKEIDSTQSGKKILTWQVYAKESETLIDALSRLIDDASHLKHITPPQPNGKVSVILLDQAGNLTARAYIDGKPQIDATDVQKIITLTIGTDKTIAAEIAKKGLEIKPDTYFHFNFGKIKTPDEINLSWWVYSEKEESLSDAWSRLTANALNLQFVKNFQPEGAAVLVLDKYGKSIAIAYLDGDPATYKAHAEAIIAYTKNILKEGYIQFDFAAVDAQNDIKISWRVSCEFNEKRTNDEIWYSLTPWAEHREFYVRTPIGKDTLGQDIFSLALVNEDGQTMASALFIDEQGNKEERHLMTEDEIEKIIHTTILQAREHPVKKERSTRKGIPDQYLIRIYSRLWQPDEAPNPDGIEGAYIWQGTRQFNTAAEATDFYKDCFEEPVKSAAMKNADGYLDTQEPDCGDFGFKLVDASRVFAWYPARFGSRQAAEAGAERMKNLLDAEGFHVVENILLRLTSQPQTPQSDEPKSDTDIQLLKLPKNLTALWEVDIQKKFVSGDMFTPCFDKYLPGSDPYSAQVTIVLPYWARRFQNARFREFFENTLRRELPAHCYLRVVWATPRDMFEFEFYYRQWLSALAQGNADKGKPELINSFNEIANFYRLILDDPRSFLDTVVLS